MTTLNFNLNSNDINELKETINQFNSFRFLPINQENCIKANQICHNLLSKLPLSCIEIDVPFIIRGRPNPEGLLFSKNSEISYHSKDLHLIKAGRFNLEQEPMFYGTIRNEKDQNLWTLGIIRECCKPYFDHDSCESTKYITLGKFYLKKKFYVINLCFDVKLLNANPKLYESVKEQIADIRKNYTISAANLIIDFWYFLSELASSKFKTENDYFITNVFWHALMDYEKTIAGLLYPSTLINNEGLNIVLRPQIVDKFLELNSVFMVEMKKNEDFPNNTFVSQYGKEVNVNNGTFSFS